MIFNGKAFAKEIEEKVKAEIAVRKGQPKIVSLLVGEEPASLLYTRLKGEAAERVGITFSVEKVREGTSKEELIKKVKELSERYDGVMIQMPIPGLSREEQREVLAAIPLEKDVDGLRWEKSGVMPATVRAVMAILEQIGRDTKSDIYSLNFVLVGSHGSVGKPLLHFLKEKGVRAIREVNSETKNPGEIIKQGEVVVSCVGKPGLITEEMIDQRAIVIDVGISKVEGKVVGDMIRDVYNVASVAVPVPGGVGPVTVASLMENIYGNFVQSRIPN